MVANMNAMPTAQQGQRHPPFDGQGAYAAIDARVKAEGWDSQDIRASFFQSSLLSYQSQHISAEEREQSQWNNIWNLDGQRYVNSTPGDYVHNCPWNDWTPPSVSRRLFALALAKRAKAAASGAPSRVRVHVVLVDTEHTEKLVIVFASVEANGLGAKMLVLRRGSEVLACLPMHTISVRHDTARERILHLATYTSPVTVCLYIENSRRLEAFRVLFD